MLLLPRSIACIIIAVVSPSPCVNGFEVTSNPFQNVNRREALGSAAVALSTLISQPLTASAAEVDNTNNVKSESVGFRAYSVIPDASASLSPEIMAIEKSSLLKEVAGIGNKGGGALWLGEHHNSIKDHDLQTDLIKAIYLQRQLVGTETPPAMAIGLEQVQIQFQSALDDYIQGKISLQEMKSQVQWDKRWIWPFDGYAPIFETAKELQIPLIALNVNSEDLAEVERAGLPGLPQDRLKQYIKDPQGFAAFAQQREFRDYVNYVIAPSYDMHERMGLLKTTISGLQLEENMSFRNFFSGRILWDESMASHAHSWVVDNPGGLLIGLVGADHVKFRDGIPGRFARMASNGMTCTSVMLNPTLIDTRPSGTVGNVADAASSQYPDRITLQLRYLKDGVDVQNPEERRSPESTAGVLPLADYIVIS
ncbi:Protein of unknown function, DUF399 [Seminavis robusta]|uniref:Haem-binding uptake Tiki superfamily ChaN domain-containing protein n=1 Tax=Seminavis robusta TaxID=568900 RepID=A0A9N8DPM2_9STRA|nr:Protein of unknown function, DUF399 [Seminavis robusta]|eukprot:Sro264_g102590.1 Protein of unknown function, DUF399 (424) ;mRNA; r:53061-54513